MVRLVSSRVHRCYSQKGGNRSARNERMLNVIHVLACTILSAHRDYSFIKSGSLLPSPTNTSGIGFLLVFLVQIFDLYAAIKAHRTFYSRFPEGKKFRSFLDIPTNVDVIVASLYIVSSLVYYFFSIILKWRTIVARNSMLYVLLANYSINFLAAFVNFALSTPSDLFMPPSMFRWQNVIVGFFTIGSLLKVYSTVLEIVFATRLRQLSLFAGGSMLFADVLIWFGSLLNFRRVSLFLIWARVWINDEMKRRRSSTDARFISWFTSSQSNFDGSDVESDGIEDA